MQVFHVITDVLDYDYIIEFGEHKYGCYGEPIFAKDPNVDNIINEFKQYLDKITSLKYTYNNSTFYIRYFKRCNKMFIDKIVKLLDNNCAYYNNITIPCQQYAKLYLRSFKMLRPIITVTSNNRRILITNINSGNILLNSPIGSINVDYNEFIEMVENKIECAILDTSVKREQSQEIKNIVNKLDSLATEIINIKASCKSQNNFDFKQLSEMDAAEIIKSDDIKLKGISDGLQAIIDFIKRVYNILNENSNEIKTIVDNLVIAVDELKEMYTKLVSQQDELIEKGLNPSEKKKLAEERKKRDEENKKKLAETEACINEIKSLSAFAGCDVNEDPDIKSLISAFNLLKTESEKTE